MRALSGPMFYPTIPTPVEGFLSFQSIVLDAAGEKQADCIYIPKTGVLARVGFRLGAVTLGRDLKISFQSPDLTTGFPNGVIDQFRVVPVADTDDNLWKFTGIMTSDGADSGALRAVTKGEPLCIVREFDSAIGNLGISAGWPVGSGQRFGQSCFVAQFTTAWAVVLSRMPLFYLEYSDGASYVIQGNWPFTTGTTDSISNTTNPNTVGLRYTAPFRHNVDGIWAGITLSASNQGFDLRLYDSALNLLGYASVDPDFTGRNNTRLVGEWALLDPITQSPTEVTLEPNAIYYPVVRGTGAGAFTLAKVIVDSASILNAWDGGSSCHKAHRQNDTGPFTLTPTERPMIGLRISGLEDGFNPPIVQGNATFKALVREVWP
jgi:hypothetical protein